MATYNTPKYPTPDTKSGVTSTPGVGAAQQYYTAYYGPEFANIDLQQAQQRNKIGYLTAAQQLAGSQSGANKNYANQDYALGMEGVGLQRGQVGMDEAYYRQLLGVNDRDLSGSMGYQDTLTTLAQQLLGLNRSDVLRQATNAREAALSSATPLGAVQSRNTRLGLTDIIAQQDSSLAQLNQGYDTQMAGIGEARRNAQLGHDKTQLGLQHQLDLNQSELSALDLRAKELGLTREKALSQLQQGLESMNLSTVIGVKDIMSALTSGDMQRMMLAEQVARQAEEAARAGYFGPPTSSGPASPSQPANNQQRKAAF